MTIEDYLADLTPGCPLCGTSETRQSRRELRARDLQRRITQLRQRLEDIERSPDEINRLRPRISDMCGTCQMLMTCISSPTDAAELCERIRKQITDLEEEINELARAA